MDASCQGARTGPVHAAWGLGRSHLALGENIG